MSYRVITIQQCPAQIQKILKTVSAPDTVKIFECMDKEDLYNIGEYYPLETTSMKNFSGSDVVGYFIVGVALPAKVDTFKDPVLAFYYMNDADWREYAPSIKTELERRKKSYMEGKTALKRITESR